MSADSALKELAGRLLESCLSDPAHPDYDSLQRILTAAVSENRQHAAAAAGILIRDVVEELSDRFEPALAQAYVEIFSRAIATVRPAFSDRFLRERYERLRAGSAATVAGANPHTVYVLSRITLGADIAITSVFLNALTIRFPKAALCLAGPEKNAELFQGMERLRHLPLDYPRRGTLAERFAVADSLAGPLGDSGCLLFDPDSRITQLGLLPIAPLQSCAYFDSRCVGAGTDAPLTAIASAWCAENLGVDGAIPAIYPRAGSSLPASGVEATTDPAPICISLGVGNNEAKRLSPAFEGELLRLAGEYRRPIVIDAGAGGAEAEAVKRAVAASGLATSAVQILEGSFSAFCATIARARLYIGYDSAGQHAAAALSVPVLTLFKGFANERMFQRWQPRGAAESRVLRIDPQTEDSAVLGHAAAALDALLG